MYRKPSRKRIDLTILLLYDWVEGLNIDYNNKIEKKTDNDKKKTKENTVATKSNKKMTKNVNNKNTNKTEDGNNKNILRACLQN